MNSNMRFAFVGLLIGLAVGYLLPRAAATPEPMPGHSAHATAEVDFTKPKPTIALDAAPDSKGGYNVHVVTSNFTFTPQKAGAANEPNTGHAHVYVNGVKLGRLYGEWFYLSGDSLKEGANEVEVTLNGNDHSEWVSGSEHLAATLSLTK